MRALKCAAFDKECDFTISCYLVESHELYFKLSLAYQVIASATIHIGVKFEVKIDRQNLRMKNIFTAKLSTFA